MQRGCNRIYDDFLNNQAAQIIIMERFIQFLNGFEIWFLVVDAQRDE